MVMKGMQPKETCPSPFLWETFVPGSSKMLPYAGYSKCDMEQQVPTCLYRAQLLFPPEIIRGFVARVVRMSPGAPGMKQISRDFRSKSSTATPGTPSRDSAISRRESLKMPSVRIS